jgi:hypothetical protein
MKLQITDIKQGLLASVICAFVYKRLEEFHALLRRRVTVFPRLIEPGTIH